MKRMAGLVAVAMLVAGCAAAPGPAARLQLAARGAAPTVSTLDMANLRSLTLRLTQVTGLISVGYDPGPDYNLRAGYRAGSSVVQEGDALRIEMNGAEAAPNATSSLVVSAQRPFTLEVAGMASKATLVLGAGSARQVVASEITQPFKFALTYPTALSLVLESGSNDVTLDLPAEEGVRVSGALSDEAAAQLAAAGFTRDGQGWVESPSAATFLSVEGRGWTGLLRLGRRRARPQFGA